MMMKRSPFIEALRDDLATLQGAGAIDASVLREFDDTLRQLPHQPGISREIRNAVSEI